MMVLELTLIHIKSRRKDTLSDSVKGNQYFEREHRPETWCLLILDTSSHSNSITKME